jgi:hypothetical protein
VFPLSSSDEKIRQAVRDCSTRSSKMVILVRRLITRLSDTVAAWDKFQRSGMGYFRYDGEPHGKHRASSLPIRASYDAIDTSFLELKGFLEKLERLKKELCEDNPQGVSHSCFHFLRNNIWALTIPASCPSGPRKQ